MSSEDISTLEEIVVSYGFSNEQEFHDMVAKFHPCTPLRLAMFRKWQQTDGTKVGLEKLLEWQKGHAV